MFRVLSPDFKDNTVFIQGARSKDADDNIASLVFQNYDDDTKLTYNMASIAMRDSFGTSNDNGFGDLLFLTSSNERMRVKYNGNIGIGTSNPICSLDVNGMIRASSITLSGGLTPMDNVLSTSSFNLTILDGSNTSTVASIYADGAPAIPNSNLSCWRFVNDATGKKINWYYMFNGSNANTTYRYKNLSTFYYKVRYNKVPTSTSKMPFVTMYDYPIGDGKDGASWYRHRVNYLGFPDMNIELNKDYLYYVGADPATKGFMNITADKKINVAFSNVFGAYVGPSNDTGINGNDILKMIAVNTNSAEAVNSIDFNLLEVGYRIGPQLTRYATYYTT